MLALSLLPRLFRLNLDAFATSLLLLSRWSIPLDNLKKLLSQRKECEAHIIEINSPLSETDLFYNLLHNLSEEISRKICIDSYLKESFSTKEIRTEYRQGKEPGLFSESSRENIRQALWDKFSQSPEMFLEEEIRNIRS